jgi:hypothetical protein
MSFSLQSKSAKLKTKSSIDKLQQHEENGRWQCLKEQRRLDCVLGVHINGG